MVKNPEQPSVWKLYKLWFFTIKKKKIFLKHLPKNCFKLKLHVQSDFIAREKKIF